MKTNWKIFGAAAATVLVSGSVLAQRELSMVTKLALGQQEVLMTGQDSSGNTRVVRTDVNGNIIANGSAGSTSTHGACTNTTMNVGTTGTACPATPRADRASLLIVLTQSGETLTVTSDGTAASATSGIPVADGSGYTDNLAGTVSTNCRCTAATCSVRIVECP